MSRVPHPHRPLWTTVLCATVCLALFSPALAADTRLSSIRASLKRPVSTPQVIALYRPEDAAAKATAARAAGKHGFQFLSADITLPKNQRLAAKDGITDTTIYTRVPGERVERFTYGVHRLSEHLSHLVLPSNPDAVMKVPSESELLALRASASSLRPVFVRFIEVGCATCVAHRSTFWRASTFLDRVQFAEFRCDTDRSTRTACASFDVDETPAYRLFTGNEMKQYEGPLTVMGIMDLMGDSSTAPETIVEVEVDVGMDNAALQQVVREGDCSKDVQLLSARLDAQEKEIQALKQTLQRMRVALQD